MKTHWQYPGFKDCRNEVVTRNKIHSFTSKIYFLRPLSLVLVYHKRTCGNLVSLTAVTVLDGHAIVSLYHLPSSSCNNHAGLEKILLNNSVPHREEFIGIPFGIQESSAQPGHLLRCSREPNTECSAQAGVICQVCTCISQPKLI